MGAVDVVTLFAGQFDLAARLDRDGRAFAAERDDTAVFIVGFIAVAIDQPTHDFFDAGRPGEGQGAAVAVGNQDFFVLGTDAPLIARLGGAREIANPIL